MRVLAALVSIVTIIELLRYEGPRFSEQEIFCYEGPCF